MYRILVVGLFFSLVPSLPAAESRPNILFAIADDWGWPHASAYGDPVVKTPTFDRIAREGLLFDHAYVSTPSCTPSRAAVLTGQYHWRLGEGANLYGTLLQKYPIYPELLESAGYAVGYSGKGWGPGSVGKRGRNPCGPSFKSFSEFLKKRSEKEPFCYWLGTSDPHRGYKYGSGKASGMKLADIKLPAAFPDAETIRNDVADYYWEVQRFDQLVGSALRSLEEAGELDNTIVVMTSDHGMPFPRGKGNLYDLGTRVPLAIRWPGKISAPRPPVKAFVNLIDLAPTFLEAAGVAIPDQMVGQTLLPIFADQKTQESERDYVLTGKERHTPCQEAPDAGGTPMRAIRTHEFLYIRNFEPDRWPAGTPDPDKAMIPGGWYGDCDNGPTKTYMIDNRNKDRHHTRLYNLSFAKRPAEELYDLKNDPEQLLNVADDPGHAAMRKELAASLMSKLKATGDPRATGGGAEFDKFPYSGGIPKKPGWKPAAKNPKPKSTGS